MPSLYATASSSVQRLGDAIPASAPHAVSVSLPKWQDNIDYEEGRPRVLNAMQTGYPRFFVHRSIQKLAGICEERFAPDDHDCCYLFPSQRVARSCAAFLAARQPPVPSRIVAFDIPVRTSDDLPLAIYAVLMDVAHKSIGKQYWQHAGEGISSRLAVHCLEQLGYSGSPTASANPVAPDSAPASGQAQRGYSRNRHYARVGSMGATQSLADGGRVSMTPGQPAADDTNPDTSVYVEERYGRNLQATLGPVAKEALRRRIAGVLGESSSELDTGVQHNIDRGVAPLNADDVLLYPSGMNAIFHAHQLAMRARTRTGVQLGRSICFGFPYTDTLKILEKWGPGCLHLGNGNEADIDELECRLSDSRDRGDPPFVSLFCEFPSNPLLRSPNLRRLRALANEYGFLIVVDETIGTFNNVEVLPWADIVVSSLTKVFSGEANVIAGSLVFNPLSRAYAVLRKVAALHYEDTLYEEDAIFLERNSRDFRSRIERIDASAETLCDFLCQWRDKHARRLLQDVFYPKYETEELYRAFARHDPLTARPRYGGLFSLTFATPELAEVFYNHLPCCKGPSLGTNFTLASPYTLLAHYTELPWAAHWGVSATLVRVSVGLESVETLMAWFDAALMKTEAASQLGRDV